MRKLINFFLFSINNTFLSLKLYRVYLKSMHFKVDEIEGHDKMRKNYRT